MYGMSAFAEKLNVQICENSMGNCVHFPYGISGFAKKLNIPNCENSTGNCLHYLCTACLDLQKNSKSKTAEIQFEIVSNTRTECLDLQKNCTSKTVKIRQSTLYLYKIFGFAENLIV